MIALPEFTAAHQAPKSDIAPMELIEKANFSRILGDIQPTTREVGKGDPGVEEGSKASTPLGNRLGEGANGVSPELASVATTQPQPRGNALPQEGIILPIDLSRSRAPRAFSAAEKQEMVPGAEAQVEAASLAQKQAHPKGINADMEEPIKQTANAPKQPEARAQISLLEQEANAARQQQDKPISVEARPADQSNRSPILPRVTAELEFSDAELTPPASTAPKPEAPHEPSSAPAPVSLRTTSEIERPQVKSAAAPKPAVAEPMEPEREIAHPTIEMSPDKVTAEKANGSLEKSTEEPLVEPPRQPEVVETPQPLLAQVPIIRTAISETPANRPAPRAVSAVDQRATPVNVPQQAIVLPDDQLLGENGQPLRPNPPTAAQAETDGPPAQTPAAPSAGSSPAPQLAQAPANISEAQPSQSAPNPPQAAAAPTQIQTATPAPQADGNAAPRLAPQLENAIEQLTEARSTAQASRPEVTLRHQEFGAVTLRLETTGSDLRATLSARDPGFVPAIQTALAERSIAASSETSSSSSQRGNEQSSSQSGSQNGSQSGAFSGPQSGFQGHAWNSGSAYGSSTGSGQGTSQPYTGQTESRDEESGSGRGQDPMGRAPGSSGDGEIFA